MECRAGGASAQEARAVVPLRGPPGRGRREAVADAAGQRPLCAKRERDTERRLRVQQRLFSLILVYRQLLGGKRTIRQLAFERQILKVCSHQ